MDTLRQLVNIYGDILFVELLIFVVLYYPQNQRKLVYHE